MRTTLTPADVTPEVFDAVAALLASRITAEDLRDKVDDVARSVLRSVELYTDLRAGRRGGKRERITENDDVYLSKDDAGLARFYKDQDTELRHRGWKPSTMELDYCPALVAENARLDSEIAVLDAAAKMLDLDFDGVELNHRLLCRKNGLEMRREFLALVVNVVNYHPVNRGY